MQKNIQVFCRIITSGTLILRRTIGSHVEFDFRALRNWARAGMVEWNGIFRLFRFSEILGQPRKVHPKFRNEIPENVCSIRSQTRHFRNLWSNGKRPWKTNRKGEKKNRYKREKQFQILVATESYEVGNHNPHVSNVFRIGCMHNAGVIIQEFGRAGRGSEQSDGYLLFNEHKDDKRLSYWTKD